MPLLQRLISFAALAAILLVPATASATTETFTTGCSSWKAPPGLFGAVAVTAIGGQGGTGGTEGGGGVAAGGSGGKGAAVSATLAGVAVGRQFRVCANAGGGTGDSGGAGGGASGLAPGSTFSAPLVVAGGGGGGGVGSVFPFSIGPLPGPNGPYYITGNQILPGALGGAAGSPGGSGGVAGVTGGGGGTTSAAGAHRGSVQSGTQPDGQPGGGPRAEGAGKGGDTHYGFLSISGGGGGAGYYGGGSASSCRLQGAGGGGGSSLCTDGPSGALALSNCAIALAESPGTSPPGVTLTYALAGAPSALVTLPVADATYANGETVATAFSCTDGLNGGGITTCLDGAASAAGAPLDTSTLGERSFSVTATSKSGLTTTQTVAYTVVAQPPAAQIAAPVGGGGPSPPAGNPPVLTLPAVVVKGTPTANFRRIANRMRVRAFVVRGASPGTRVVVRCVGSHCPKRVLAPPSARPARPHSPRRCAPCACVPASACAPSSAAAARRRSASPGTSASEERRNP